MNQDVNLLKYLATVDASIGKLYDKLIKELAKIGASISDLDTGKLFSFADYPQVKERVEKILDKYIDAVETRITDGMKDAIDMSYLANTTFLKDYSKLSDKAIKTQRENAKEAFIRSRSKYKDGLGLSNRVWNYTNQARAEFEAGMSEVIEEGLSVGMSAEELGRKVRDKLKYPEMVYKRYHLKKLTKEGKKDVIEWRKKIVDEDGKVRFIKTELDMVGRGVYRSSRKNTLRLAATEINMAYRYADNVRWQSEPFIRGIRIRLSKNHTCNGKPFYDICDELQGDYPKSFMWSGWHPRCRCSASPILIPQEEMDEISNLSEEEYQNYRPKDLITTMPSKFKDWFDKNKERVTESISRGTQPYFIRDNKAIIDNLFNPKKRTSEQEQKLIDFWNEKKKRTSFLRNRAENVMRVYNERFGFDVPGLSVFENAVKNGDLNDIDTYTKKFAKNLSTVQRNIRKKALNQIELAKDVPEVDYSELEDLLKGNNIGLIRTARTELEQRMFDMIDAENALSDLIEDVRELHKLFNISDLKISYNELSEVMNRWLSKYGYSSIDEAPLSHLKNKLSFELANPTTSYTNHSIIDKILRNKISIIEKKIQWNELIGRAEQLRAFKTKSSAYKMLINNIDDAISNDDFDALQNAISMAESKQHELIGSRKSRVDDGTALNKEYKGGAIGKDITSQIDVSNMVSEDPYRGTFTNNVARMQGFDSPAKLVSEKEFEKLVQDCGDVFYRTLNPAIFKGKRMSGEEFANQLFLADKLELNGPGGRVYGDGIYVASSSWNGRAVLDIDKDLMESAYAESAAYGYGEHKTLELTWARKPNIIKQEDLSKLWYKLTDEEKMRYGGIDSNYANTYACALGYDAMYCKRVGYIVVWNRSIIAVKNK